MKKIAALAATTALLAAPAFAGGPSPVIQDPVIAAPIVVAPSYDWTGGYAGLQLGYGSVDLDGGIDGDGAIGGVHAGYMWDFGQWVLGGELDYDAANIDLEDGAGIDVGDLDSVARLKLRAGYDLGRSLIYATAGAAHAEAEVGGADLSDTGWFAGVGMGYQLNNNWIVGGEVLTHQFDDFDNSGVDVDATTATLRASFKF